MKAIISNSKYGKSVVFNNIVADGEFLNANTLMVVYSIKTMLDEETGYSTKDLYEKLTFPIDKIEIFDSIKNENGEIEEVLIKSITDKHNIYSISISIENDVYTSSDNYYNSSSGVIRNIPIATLTFM